MINKMAMLLLCCHQKQKCCGGMGCTVVQQVSSCRTYVAIIEQLWNRESNPVNQLMCVCVCSRVCLLRRLGGNVSIAPCMSQ